MTGSASAIAGKLRELLREIAGIPLERITDSASIDNELVMQSVAFVELQVAIEEEYDVEVDPIRVVELNEFGAIVSYVHGLVQAK
jgi:acyl carrier protein